MKWEMKKLGEVCTFLNGKAHEKDIAKNGKYIVVNSKFISSNGQVFKRSDKQLFSLYKGDIAMVMSDVPNGKALAKCFLVDKDDTYSLNQRICCIRSNKFDLMFLFYQLNRHKHLLSFNNGENQTNLRKNDILNCPLLIPPLPIQKEIVSKLSKIFSLIEKMRANVLCARTQLQSFFENYLHHIFCHADDWEMKKLGEVCEVITGQSPESKFYNTQKKGIPFYQGKKEFGEKYIGVPKIWTTKITKVAQANDILMSIRAPVGPINFATEKICIGRGLSSIRVGKAIDRDFLFYFLLMNENKLEGNAGAVFNSINRSQIENITLPLPPLETQKEIVSRLDFVSARLRSLQSVYARKLSCFESLRQSLLAEVFGKNK